MRSHVHGTTTNVSRLWSAKDPKYCTQGTACPTCSIIAMTSQLTLTRAVVLLLKVPSWRCTSTTTSRSWSSKETITPQWTTASASSTTGAMAVHPPQWCGCCHVCWPWCNCCLLWCAWTFNMHTPSPSTSWILLQYHPTFQEVVQLISTPVACHFSLQGAHPTGFTAVHYP